MTRLLHRSRRIGRDNRGAAITEFAIVAPVMILMLMGFFDLGHAAYVRAVLQGAVQKAARDGTLEGGGGNANAINASVVTQVSPIASVEAANFTFERLSYTNFSQVRDAEEFEDDNSNDIFDPATECYEDENGNGQWDSDIGLDGQGGASDVVLYNVTVTYPRLFPMANLLGWSSNNVVTASTVLRNQPFGEQDNPSVARCPT